MTRKPPLTVVAPALEQREDEPFEPFEPEPQHRKRRRNGKSEQHGPPLSDDWLALGFVDKHGDGLRYVEPWKRWLQLSQNRCQWQEEETRLVNNLVRVHCRELAEKLELDNDAAMRLTGWATFSAVEKVARDDRRVASSVDRWDADPWLLNTPEGAIDPRVGGKPVPRPDAYCTKATAVAGGTCPLWLAFLERVTAGAVELQTFLQRVAGYCLTGSTEEHALFFLYGQRQERVSERVVVGAWRLRHAGAHVGVHRAKNAAARNRARHAARRSPRYCHRDRGRPALG